MPEKPFNLTNRPSSLIISYALSLSITILFWTESVINLILEFNILILSKNILSIISSNSVSRLFDLLFVRSIDISRPSMFRELFKLKSETNGKKLVLSVSRKSMVSDSLFDNEISLKTTSPFKLNDEFPICK